MKVWSRLLQPGGAPLSEDSKPNVYLYRLEAHSETPICSELCSKCRVSWQQREETKKEIEVRTIDPHGKVTAARRRREIEKTDGRKCRNDLGTKHTQTQAGVCI
jgi:hypothetical protein